MKTPVSRAMLSCALMASALPLQAQDVLLDWNTSAPQPAGYWAVQEVGWFFTPEQSMWVSFMGTRFGSYGTDRNVTAEIRTAPGADGGVSLVSGTFNSSTARTGIGGFSFTSLLLEAGTQYFLGFRNLMLLGSNVTSVGTDGPSSWRAGYTTNGLYNYQASGNYRPVLELMGLLDVPAPPPEPPVEEEVFEEEIITQTSHDLPDNPDYETQSDVVTPEPISMILLGTGLAGLGAVRRRRRKNDA